MLIADLYEKRTYKRLYLKSELLKLCRENPERLDKLIQWEVLKPRQGKFELNQSLLESFSALLRLPTSAPRFSLLMKELKESESVSRQSLGQTPVLAKRKTLLRNLEESILQALEEAAINHDVEAIEKLANEFRQLRSFLWEEKGLRVYRDVEMDGLIQDLEQLLQEALNSLENIKEGLGKGRSTTDSLQTKMMKLTGLQRGGKLRTQTNLEMILNSKHPLLLEQAETFKPRITSQQLKEKSSLNFLSKFNKKAKKR